MLRVYGALMPVRLLEEIRFWKEQESEHTVVIRSLVPALEPGFVRMLEEWAGVLQATEADARAWLAILLPYFGGSANIPADSTFSPPAHHAGGYPAAAAGMPQGIPVHQQSQVSKLAETALTQSRRFVAQLSRMLEDSRAVQAVPAAPVVIRHIIRESAYFIGVLEAFLTGGARQAGSETAAAARRSETGAGTGDAPERITLTGEGTWSQAVAAPQPVPVGGHTLPPLPYPYHALEPHIDAETMKLHHDKHHQSYVDGLNKAELMLAGVRQSGDFALIKHWEREAAFNGAGHYLHTLFWESMAPGGGKPPAGGIAAQIARDFGSFTAFRSQFTAAAEKVEGGGWALLVWCPRSHRLEILQAEKHQNLSQWDVIPLLPLDVWEHAYYLKYQNDRAGYVAAWWNVVDWRHVEERFQKARTLKWVPF